MSVSLVDTHAVLETWTSRRQIHGRSDVFKIKFVLRLAGKLMLGGSFPAFLYGIFFRAAKPRCSDKVRYRTIINK